MSFIQIKNLIYDYVLHDENDNVIDVNRAVNDVTMNIEAGDFVVILGHNGSGKSTFARTLNGLNIPVSGDVIVDGMNTKDEDSLLDIRKTVGMVFQNPDNQIIGNVVEEDVAFGPENIGIPTEEIWTRVEEAIGAVGMEKYREKSPNKLSGGQKQRVAIAGVMAMRPKCIVLDEPTAMLDPSGRAEVLKTIRRLNKEEGITIILITHYMEEAVYADKIFVMDKGSVVMEGAPRDILTQAERLEELRLTVPETVKIANELRSRGVNLRESIIFEDELIDELLKICR